MFNVIITSCNVSLKSHVSQAKMQEQMLHANMLLNSIFYWFQVAAFLNLSQCFLPPAATGNLPILSSLGAVAMKHT